MMERSPAYYLALVLTGVFVPVLLIFGMVQLNASWHPSQTEKHYQDCLKVGGSYKTQSDVHGSSWYCIQKGNVILP